MDVNGNGYMSLAEIDKGLRDVIQLPEIFDLKPVIMRAYQTARTISPAKNKHSDDYVTKNEFKYLLYYLRQYYEYWVGFDEVDKDDDRRISYDEFVKAVPMMEKWGIKITDPEASFKEADSDGHGKILFVEFVEWSTKHSMDLPDDDDFA